MQMARSIAPTIKVGSVVVLIMHIIVIDLGCLSMT